MAKHQPQTERVTTVDTEPLKVVLLIDALDHASSDLRGYGPLHVLEEARLAYTGVHSLKEVMGDNNEEDLKDPNSVIRKFAADVEFCDILVIPQTSALGWNKFIAKWQEMGKVVVMDVDDDVRYVSPLSPTYETRGTRPVWARADGTDGSLVRVPLWEDGKKGFDIAKNKDWQASFHAGLAMADIVTCPTERFAATIRAEINPRAVALPNSLDLDTWVPGRHPGRPDEFRICWHGGDSHRMDVGAAAAGVGQFLKEHPEAIFVLIGAPLTEWKAEINPAQLEYWDWGSYDAHAWRLMGLGLDVGLCPVVDHKFNDAKSPLKWAEFSSLGIPVIASNCPPYSDTVRDGEDGILVPNDPSAWAEALSRVYADKSYRERIGAAGRARVEQDFDRHKNAIQWYELYKSLIAEKKGRKVITEVA